MTSSGDPFQVNDSEDKLSGKPPDHQEAQSNMFWQPGQAAPPHSPIERIGKYKILGVINEGGMGTVYRAIHEELDLQVAIKVIRADRVSQDYLNRFRREMRVLSRLKHPGIAQIFEAKVVSGEDQADKPYLVMEYIEPRTIIDYARNLTVRQRLLLLQQVCDALHHAHQRRIIHRDLKPENILIDSSGQPKIIDFGIARLEEVDPQWTTLGTETGQLLGTISYMSPEQVKGDPDDVDIRSDVYALGVIGFELLTGELPYDLKGMTIPQKVMAICERAPRPPSAIRAELHGDIEAILCTALEKDKELRYAGANSLAEDIVRHLNHLPLPRRTSTWYHIRKFTRRNRGIVASVLCIFLILLLGIIGTYAGFLEAEDQRDTAQKALQEKDKLYIEVNKLYQNEVRIRENLTKSYADNAVLAADRGYWRNVLTTCDQALAARTDGASPETDKAINAQEGLLHLKKIDARIALNEKQAAEEGLARLENASCAGVLAGPILLRRGCLLISDLWSDKEPGYQRIEKARKAGLPESDDLYAQALLANTFPEAIQLLKEAIDRSPFHPHANKLLFVLLTISGEFEELEARLGGWRMLYPETSEFNILFALKEVLQGNRASVEAIVARAASEGQAHAAIAQIFMQALLPAVSYCQELNDNAEGYSPAAAISTFVPLFVRLNQLPVDKSQQQGLNTILPFPTCITRLAEPAKSFMNTVIFRSTDKESFDKLVKSMDDMLAIIPLAEIHFIKARLYQRSFRPEEALKACEEAFKVKSLVGVMPMLLYDTIQLRWNVAQRKAQADPNLKQDLEPMIRELLQLGVCKAHHLKVLAKIAARSGLSAVARLAVDDWRRLNPGSVEPLESLADVYMAEEAFFLAAEVLQEILHLEPGNKKAQAALSLVMEKLNPRKN